VERLPFLSTTQQTEIRRNIMANKNFAALANEVLNPEAAPTADAPSNNKPKAQIWANLGVTLPMKQADGTMKDTFCSMPKGVPFDTMEPMTARGNNVENNQKVEIGNLFMGHWQEWAEEQLGNGDAQVVTIEVELRRVNEQGTAGTTASGAKNPMIAELQKHIQLVK
jgi:hypothetical protein